MCAACGCMRVNKKKRVSVRRSVRSTTKSNYTLLLDRTHANIPASQHRIGLRCSTRVSVALHAPGKRMQVSALKRIGHRAQQALTRWTALEASLRAHVDGACEALRGLPLLQDATLCEDALLREQAKLRQVEALDAALQGATEEVRMRLLPRRSCCR